MSRAGFDVGRFSCARGSGRLAREVEVVGETASTNDLALAWTEPAGGRLVVAEHQTRGRGRSGRSWSAPPRAAILASLRLEDEVAPAGAVRVTLAAAVAVCRALAGAGLDAAIKWPNDVLVRERKIAGILCEGRTAGGRIRALVLGVGVNVDQDRDELPEGATSVRLETGHGVGREELLAAILAALEPRLDGIGGTGWQALREEWEALAPLQRGRRLTVVDGERVIEGVGCGLDADGALLLRRDDGGLERVLSGSLLAPGRAAASE